VPTIDGARSHPSACQASNDANDDRTDCREQRLRFNGRKHVASQSDLYSPLPERFVQSIDPILEIDAMNLTAIDLNLLVALDALISEVHVGRAARRIRRSQPTTSYALKRLRTLFDDPLLVQVGSRMELTPRAASLREPVADALRRVQTLLAAESFVAASSTRLFTVMMQDHVAHLVLPALVERLNVEAPGVRLNVVPWQSPASATPEQLRSIDMLISCTTKDIAGFERETLFRTPSQSWSATGIRTRYG
jgi:hypothetical protein